MAASSPDEHHAGPTWKRKGNKHRRSHVQGHLQVQVPGVAATGCFAGCFRPFSTSGSTSPVASSAYANADRPASPSLIRSPTAWIRARGHSFGSLKDARRRSGDFQYDTRSYARNFDEGSDGDGTGDEAGLNGAGFSARLPSSPPGDRCDGGVGKGKEATREKVCDME